MRGKAGFCETRLSPERGVASTDQLNRFGPGAPPRKAEAVFLSPSPGIVFGTENRGITHSAQLPGHFNPDGKETHGNQEY